MSCANKITRSTGNKDRAGFAQNEPRPILQNTKPNTKMANRKQKGSKNRAPGKTQISISLPENLVAKIDQLAEAENRNRSNFIANEMRRLVEKWEVEQDG